MSFTILDTGFSSGRYPFDGLDFGPLSDGDEYRVERCGTCGHYEVNTSCVACADYAFIAKANLANTRGFARDTPNLEKMSDTMGAGDGDVPDSVGGQDGDVPDSIGGDDDEDEGKEM